MSKKLEGKVALITGARAALVPQSPVGFSYLN